MLLVSWRLLLDEVLKGIEQFGDKSAGDDIRQLQGLCERMDTELFIPVTADELSDKRYRRIIEFGRILDEATDILVKRGTAATKGLSYTTGNGWYGRYFRLSGVDSLFVCDIRKWMTYATTPLWLSIYGSNWLKSSKAAARLAVESLERGTPPRVFIASDGFPTIALMVPTGEESDAIVRSLVSQVEEISQMIVGLAPPQTEPAHDTELPPTAVTNDASS